MPPSVMVGLCQNNTLRLVFLLRYLQVEELKRKNILGLLCTFFYFWIDYSESGAPPLSFFSSLFLFCSFVPFLEGGNGQSIGVKDIKNVSRRVRKGVKFVISILLTSPLPYFKTAQVLRMPEVCWEHYSYYNIKVFSKGALYSP